MKIQTVPADTISDQGYQSTSLPNVFVKPETGMICIIDNDSVYEIEIAGETGH